MPARSTITSSADVHARHGFSPSHRRKFKSESDPRRTYKLFDGGGLYLEVIPSGSKLWRMKFRQARTR
ncbi:Arm DNA-binding domain-containing protein [Duganella sp. HH101]|uniref:Arm DNA-binding domain-containing protein n=1 Tax=Duganella sp. HH101 TaxID=1781066 RepID=UPI0035A5E182